MKVTAPIKPKKTRQNQPQPFKESLALGMPMSAAASALPALTQRQLRIVLVAVWVAAMVLGGIGIGRAIVAQSGPRLRAVAPVPVAKATVRVAPSPDSALSVAMPPASTTNLTVTPATAVSQAQAGNPFETVAAPLFQAADATLQPGFTAYGHAQGNIGTTPVR